MSLETSPQSTRGCRLFALVLATSASALIYGCGGGGPSSEPEKRPAALELGPLVIHVDEDSIHSGALTVGNFSGSVTFRLSALPTNGTVQLNGATGEYTYVPAPDYFGPDSFALRASDTTGASAIAAVAVQVRAVDDPPEIDALPDAENSADVHEVAVPLRVRDPDGDSLTITATADNAGVVDVVVNRQLNQLLLRPADYGSTAVRVQVSDGHHTVSTDFTFTVAELLRSAQVHSSSPSSEAVVLTNTSIRSTEFELTHNGKHAFTSMNQILAVVSNLPDELPAEPFVRKLWRYVRDNTYHYPPASGAGWMDATWPILNSFGWGFCSNLTSVFIQLAEVAGIEARAWGLTGHVTAEVRNGDGWQMYDPDIAVYYYRRDGEIASIADLAADPALITSPVNAIFEPESAAYASAYDPLLGLIYGTADDNFVDPWYPNREPFHGSRITLPPGGRLIYPGRWSENPITYDGDTPYTVEYFRQAKLEITAGTVGTLRLPWVLWDVQGSGTVRIRDQDYEANAPALRARLLAGPLSTTEIEIVENNGLALIMMINPLWYDMLATNNLVLTGKDVWAIDARSYALAPANRPPPPVPEFMRKPRA